MKYVGSKNRISKEIVPIIQKCIDENNIKTYIEPFVGGANLIDKIKCETRIGNDNNKYLIALLQELQNGWIPPENVSEEEYKDVQHNKDKYPDYIVGYYGFCISFGAKWFGGYARSFKADKITPRNHPQEAYNNIIKQIPKLMDIKFIHNDYKEFIDNDLKNAVIYCDPPYQGTLKYSDEEFDYNIFWDYVRKLSANNYVFVSEYNAPKDFKCIWSKEHKVLIDSNRSSQDNNNIRIENLFIHSNNFNKIN